MADATADQIKFAQSRIDYFEKTLNKGEQDKLKALVKVTGATTISDIKAKIVAAKDVTQQNIDDAKAAAKKATDDANAMTVVAGVTQQNIDDAKAAAKKATDDANAMTVGASSPIIKATNDACPNIKDTTKATESEVTTCFADGFKDYGFINAILKNIPNKADKVLTKTSDSFDNYAADLIKTGNEDKLAAANFYYKLVGTVCGFAPFDGEQSKLPAGTTKCYEQANKVAVAILSSPNCGSDKLDSGAVKGACYTELAIGNLYNNGDTDAMFIDISHAYPDDVVTV